MTKQQRNYDYELVDVLAICRQHNALIDPYPTSGVQAEQPVPVLRWVIEGPEGEEHSDADA